MLRVAVVHPNGEKDKHYDAFPENVFYHRAVERLVAEDLEVRGGEMLMREERHNHSCRCGAVHRLILKLKIRCRADNDADTDIPPAYQEQEGGIELIERGEGVELEIMRNDLSNYEQALEKVSMDL